MYPNSNVPKSPDQITNEGQVVVSCVTVPSGQWTYYAVKVYVAKKRADGVLTWRADEKLTDDYRSPAKAIAEWREDPMWNHLDLAPNVRHGVECP